MGVVVEYTIIVHVYTAGAILLSDNTAASQRTKHDRVQDIHEEQELWMNKLDWVGTWLNQFEMFEEHENCL